MQVKKKIHFIAIGGSAMHNLALALARKGVGVSGSDDEIGEPSRSRLSAAGILPEKQGWFPEKLHQSVDAVILGMHARADNPELAEAQRLGLRIYSYPEYVYEQSIDKTRVVIGGSHGKTTITAMILHVLRFHHVEFDYLVGSKLDGFETMVQLTDAPVIVLEGDEYLSSAIDRRPKFHLYRPHIALISGIAWDHVNVFPTYEIYQEQFSRFIELIEEGGKLIYCGHDSAVSALATRSRVAHRLAYRLPAHRIDGGITRLRHEDGSETALGIFGDHNLLNLEGARAVCAELGIQGDRFYKAIASFKGAERRLQKLAGSQRVQVFKDFAHSPSKLKATLAAVRKQFEGSRLTACMELHTFSSLNDGFLEQYKNTMNDADRAIVYFNPNTVAQKKLAPVSPKRVKDAFNREDLTVITDSESLHRLLTGLGYANDVLLLMSSGDFDGMDLAALAGSIS